VSRVQRPYQYIIGHFGDESFQSITCSDTDNLTRTTKRQNTAVAPAVVAIVVATLMCQLI